RFGLRVIRHVKSNGILVVNGFMVLGVGAGQVNRVNAVRLALAQAGEKARGAYLISDAFFPFPDGPEAALQAGVRAIASVQGALREAEVIEVVNKHHGILVLVNERHFRH
ncbi:MAG: bifunctional phosphoribosylaminoimidazolecarboxamide formyltransferase/IMP cyclohydrolase PurH, partial [Actinobacteria bacterium]|nr:bifunctional phosphoribosylaminoimidazolecarboxamide formyltransferase/IMP cyclohydrolase PurH [Actinomycetota bacterium]